MTEQKGLSFEDEERALRSGRGRMLAGMIAAVVLVLVGVIWVLRPSGDETYRTFGRNVNGFDREYFDAFWSCALKGADLRNIRSDRDLLGNLHRRGIQGGQRYGALVKERCFPRLEDLQEKLDGLIPPEGLQQDLTALRTSTTKLRSAWSDYIGYLVGLDGPYVEEDAQGPANGIARGWYEYKHAHKIVNDKLREKIAK